MLIRSHKNPILRPNEYHNWESRKVYNCAAIKENGEYHMFYRAVGSKWTSVIGYAYSFDGEKFIRFDQPLIKGEMDFESKGVEDPRIVKINETYFLTYTGYDGITARLCLAVSKDMKQWEKHGPMLPNWNAQKAKAFDISWDQARNNEVTRKKWVKAGGMFPEIIGGKFWMLFGDSNIWISSSADGSKWKTIQEPFLTPRKKYFDSVHLEMGPPPIKTKKGWLVLYHGIDKNIKYRLGYLLLDIEDPSKILFRSDEPIFEPTEPYEKYGIEDILPGGLKGMETMDSIELGNFIKNAEKKEKNPDIVFCCGAILNENILRIYYGAGDTVIGTATTKLDYLLDI